MGVEIEATFTGINKDAYRARLKTAGAELKQKEILMKRVVFDISAHAFLRVRDEGDRITMSYKHSHSNTLSGMEEICLNVNSYDEAVNFLLALGFKIKSRQEAYREEWVLDGAEITIDTWPWLPPYTEIEGPSESAVESVAARLGFDMEDAIYGSASTVYARYYDVSEHEVDFHPEILFSLPSPWPPRQNI